MYCMSYYLFPSSYIFKGIRFCSCLNCLLLEESVQSLKEKEKSEKKEIMKCLRSSDKRRTIYKSGD